MSAVGELDAMKAAFESLEPLEPAARSRAMSWLAETLGVQNPMGTADAPIGRGVPLKAQTADVTEGQVPKVKAFMTDKRPGSDVERIACLGYYAANFEGTTAFKTKDLTDLNTEAAGPKFGNPSQASDNALKKGLLTQAGGGRRQMTSRGEAVVEALPDRDAVKAALSELPAPKKRKPRKAAKTAS